MTSKSSTMEFSKSPSSPCSFSVFSRPSQSSSSSSSSSINMTNITNQLDDDFSVTYDDNDIDMVSDLVWPWSPPKQPTLTPTTYFPSTMPTPTHLPTHSPIPKPTPQQFVIGVDDDYWTPPSNLYDDDDRENNHLFDDDELKNLTSTTTYENQEIAFYKTSTMMLFITLCMSGFLHLYTWNNIAKEEERRASFNGDDINHIKYNEDGTINTGLRPRPVISYGGNSYGTKVATSPIQALQLLAKRSRSNKKPPKGYSLVNGEYNDDDEEEEDEDAMIDRAIEGRKGGILNQDGDFELVDSNSSSQNGDNLPMTTKFMKKHNKNGAEELDHDDEDDDEVFLNGFLLR
mmetsp:Transcript_40390/g.51995  ORF Transcript_40390/g.51995 Transcript_40390/m.51995 type:complete len:345 (-) Transcript_40390:3034-4068(-)